VFLRFCAVSAANIYKKKMLRRNKYRRFSGASSVVKHSFFLRSCSPRQQAHR